MKMYHLALMLIALATLLGLIARQLGRALASGSAQADAGSLGSLIRPSRKLSPAEPLLADQSASLAPRTRQRTLKRPSAGGGGPNLAQQFLERDIYGQLELNLERAFESYVSGRTTLSRYRKTVSAERLAMIRHLDEISADRPQENVDRSQTGAAKAALAAIDWCLSWADDIECQKRSDCDNARSAETRLQDAA